MTTIEALRAKGFDIKQWGMNPFDCESRMQITDATGITFYMAESATLEECQARYVQKLLDFIAAEQLNQKGK
jgi:hypothetical protein